VRRGPRYLGRCPPRGIAHTQINFPPRNMNE
jgi:hypothetical protein